MPSARTGGESCGEPPAVSSAEELFALHAMAFDAITGWPAPGFSLGFVKVTEQTSAGALTQETSYSYSLLDTLILVNQGNQGRAYKHDARGRLLYEKIPEQTATINDGTGTTWTSAYTYTEYGAVKKKTDARGVESHYLYDAVHNVTQIWFTGVGGDDSGSVRPPLPSGVAATGDRLFAYTASEDLSSVSIPNEYTETYAFDTNNQVSSVTRWILGQTYSTNKTYTTNYEYNLGSQLTKIIYPSGQQISVNRDDKGRMQSLTNEPGDPSGYLTGLGYNTAGQVTGLTLGNGVVQTYGYDAQRMQMTTQTAMKGTTSLLNLAYSYQATAGQSGVNTTAGNTHQMTSISGTIAGTTESASYTYDLQKRLATSSQTSNGASAQRRFVYDRWANRTAAWDAVTGGNQIQSVVYLTTFQEGGSAPTNRISSVTNSGSTLNYAYDAAGNVTNDGLHSYAFDAENRLVSIDAGATAQYKYDHQNRRVSRIVGSTWMHYVWEGSHVIGEHDWATAYSTGYAANSARADYIYFGDRLIRSRQRSSGTAQWVSRYYVNDRLSERLTLDSSGNVVGRQAHLPFGEDFAESGTQDKRHFTSYDRDGAAGLDYAVNRSYISGIGRFNSADPYEESGSQFGPQGWNRYAYVENDPIHNVDPLGLNIKAPNPESPDPCGTPPGGGSSCGEGNCTQGPEVPKQRPQRLYAGFDNDGLQTIERAIWEAIDLVIGIARNVDIDNDCRRNLAARTFSGGRTIDVSGLIFRIVFWRAKPRTADETVWGPFDIVNGAKSQASDIVDFRQHNPGAGGAIWGNSILLFSGFFGGSPGHRIGFDRSRGVALIHDAIHLLGFSDLDFGANREEGSRNINTFVIQSCVNKRLTHNDLSFVVN